MNKQRTKVAIFKNKLSLAGIRSTDLTWTGILAILAIIAPAFLAHTPQNQLLTGTIVNAILFFATWKVGMVNAMIIAIIPSSVALMRGLLPIPMVVFLPYIIFSNCLLVATFSALKKTKLLGVAVASLVKFGVLFVATLMLSSSIGSPLVTMMQWPQLLTALSGGLVAFAVISVLEKK